ncbi:hypothetical protein V1502_20060 [Bacillus sp. SCS-153A]|uniref:hypothetical protein n=1 Tax=Rossellomorea sedimentorum TaxID=3115294 RepID=UPI0039058D8B
MYVVKWGILGAANIAKKAIIPTLKNCDNAEVTAIASISGKEEETAKVFSTQKNMEAMRNCWMTMRFRRPIFLCPIPFTKNG